MAEARGIGMMWTLQEVLHDQLITKRRSIRIDMGQDTRKLNLCKNSISFIYHLVLYTIRTTNLIINS